MYANERDRIVIGQLSVFTAWRITGDRNQWPPSLALNAMSRYHRPLNSVHYKLDRLVRQRSQTSTVIVVVVVEL